MINDFDYVMMQLDFENVILWLHPREQLPLPPRKFLSSRRGLLLQLLNL